MLHIRRDNWQNDGQFDEIQQIERELVDIRNNIKSNWAEPMTTTVREAMVNPGEGRLVLDTTLGKLAFYTAGAWEIVSSAP